jgi:hypothetical protein
MLSKSKILGETMKLNTKRVLLLLLFGIALMNTASAANSSEMKLTDFTSGSNPIDGIGDAKPLMLEVVAIVVGFFLLTCIIAAFLSGSTANVGSIMHNASIRSRGIVGVVTVLGVVGVVIVTLILFFHMYNKYLAGM